MSKRITILIGAALIVVIASIALATLSPGANLNKGRVGPSTEDVIINEDVVIYTEESAFEILGCDDRYVTVSSLDGLAEGRIIAAGITEETPSGLLRRIKSIEGDEAPYTLYTDQASLTEAIDKCSISYTISLTEDGTYEIVDNKAPEKDSVFQQAYAAELRNGAISLFDDALELTAGDQIEVSLDVNWGEIKMRVVNHFTAETKLNLAKLILSNGEKEIDLTPDMRLCSFCFFVGPLPVVFDNDISIDLTLSGSTAFDEIAVRASLDKSFGFEYSSAEGLKPVFEDKSTAPAFTFSEETDNQFSVDAEAVLGAHFSSMLYGCAGPNFSVSLKGEVGGTLEFLAEGESDEGAIELMGLGRKLKGEVFEKVTVPITGEFLLHVPFNPFDVDGTEISAEIFDTGDAITILDESQQFAEAGKASFGATGRTVFDLLSFDSSYTTKFSEVAHIEYPVFEFSLPAGWEVAADDVNEAGDLFETISVQNGSGIEVVYSDLSPNVSGVYNSSIQVLIEKVADSSFEPGALQGEDWSSLGEFMVARVTLGAWHHDGSTDYDTGELGQYYAVLPVSMEGEHEFNSAFPDVFLSFKYPRLISFYCEVPEGGLSTADENAVVSILSSFKEV